MSTLQTLAKYNQRLATGMWRAFLLETRKLNRLKAVLKRWLSIKTTEVDEIDWLHNTPPMTSSYSPNEIEREKADEATL